MADELSYACKSMCQRRPKRKAFLFIQICLMVCSIHFGAFSADLKRCKSLHTLHELVAALLVDYVNIRKYMQGL